MSRLFKDFYLNFFFSNFHNNNIFTICQSGFMPGDSWTSQLLSIVHEIQSSYDYQQPTDVRAILLDILKAFDKVWHQGLLFKLKSYRVESNFLRLLENCLDSRKQRVKLNDQCSSWKIIRCGVPQGSALGPFQFLIHLNDLPNGINSTKNAV